MRKKFQRNSFYAVTEDTVYYINAKKEETILKKVPIRNCKTSNNFPDKIPKNLMISIGKNLIIFIPKLKKESNEKERQISKVGGKNWRWQSSKVIGLFFEPDKAKQCFASKIFDKEHWIDHSKEVISKIDPEHKVFSIPTNRHLTLFY